MPTDPTRYQRIAPWYDLLDLPFETLRYRTLRPLLFQDLTGRILDAGVGTGRNIPFYPPDAEVVGIDNSPAMLARAERRRLRLGHPMTLREMDVTRLALPDDQFDAAVATFLFCVLPESAQAPALRELGRVVRPGGAIRILTYRRPSGRLRGFVARLWEPWMAWAYGAGFDRRTIAHVSAAGLELVRARAVVGDLVWLFELRVPG